MRKFCIGDIRGDLDLLKRLMDKIGPSENDVMIFLGSYIGPGSDSRGVMDFLLDARTRPGTWIFLRGCYEYMFQRSIGVEPNIEMMRIWHGMGGSQVFRSYAAKNKLVVMQPANGRPRHSEVIEIPLHIPEAHIKFMEQEMHCMFTDELLPFIACHNGYYAGVAGENIPEEFSVFTPNGWWHDDRLVVPGKEIIYSHIPAEQPLFSKGKIDIDLGAGFGGKLCAMEMYERKFTIVGG